MAKKKFVSGASIDTRPLAETRKDYHFGEVVASADRVVWEEKAKKDWRKFPIFDQNGSGSCVAQTLAKLLGVLYWLRNGAYVHFSATHIYQRRSNKPSGGMIGVNAFEIAQDGVTLEDLVPSQKMTDSQMDGATIEQYKKDVGSVFKIGNYVQPGTGNIDTVASIIQRTGKAVMVWFYFDENEWTAEPKVTNTRLNLYGTATLRHSVAAVDYTLVKGKKYLVIEDSWGPKAGNGAGQRLISEDFFKARNWFTAYAMDFKFAEGSVSPVAPGKPKYRFTKSLEFIDWDTALDQPADLKKHNAQKQDVILLQDALRWDGVFPANIESTGYYGSVTAGAVLKFQRKHSVDSEAVLAELQGMNVGPKTRAQLNRIFS